MIEHTKYYVLLSEVYEKQDKMEDSFMHLTKAKEMQSRLGIHTVLVTNSDMYSVSDIYNDSYMYIAICVSFCNKIYVYNMFNVLVVFTFQKGQCIRKYCAGRWLMVENHIYCYNCY